jgi:hypothetical protein
MIFAPLEGRREAIVTERHTAIDYAHALEHVADVMFPQATKIVLVQDNLNTHRSASLYQAFAPEKARRLTERFEWRHTPKHGSRLDMAESELGVLSSQCLARRIGDIESLRAEVAAWVADRNTHQAKADWQYTTADARIKLSKASTDLPRSKWPNHATRAVQAAYAPARPPAAARRRRGPRR